MVGRPSGHRTWDGRPDVESPREEHIPRLDRLGSGKQRKGLPIAEVQERWRKMRKEETVTIDLLHRAVPAKYTDEGLRAFSGENPIRPESVQKYLGASLVTP